MHRTRVNCGVGPCLALPGGSGFVRPCPFRIVSICALGWHFVSLTHFDTVGKLFKQQDKAFDKPRRAWEPVHSHRTKPPYSARLIASVIPRCWRWVLAILVQIVLGLDLTQDFDDWDLSEKRWCSWIKNSCQQRCTISFIHLGNTRALPRLFAYKPDSSTPCVSSVL